MSKSRCLLGALFSSALLVGARQFCFAADASAPICVGCHPKETARYLATAMGQSLIRPAPLPPGRIVHAASESVITSEQRDGQMFHGLSERGLTAEYSVKYQMGGRLMGRTYIVQTGDYLFESPASWFNRYGWDVSPGYARMPVIDFDRAIDEQCLFCHAGLVRFGDTDGHKVGNQTLTAITCERCHGSPEAHLRHPSSKNIVNPANLSGTARNSVCEQCHLEGATRILNPGKSWTDFHPGEVAEKTFATYLLGAESNNEVVAVSQVEQLAQSKCVRASGGKLWCGTCHQSHGEVSDRGREIRTICTSCHRTLSAIAHPPEQQECTTCHMPRSSTTDIPHAALTDHRILRQPAATSIPQVHEQKMFAWREPPSEFRERDLGLAEILIGFTKNIPALAEQGFHAVQALPPEQQRDDPAVLSDLEGLYLQQENLEAALRSGRRAVELRPQSAKAAMNLGVVLSRSGNLAEAEQQLGRAIHLDPSLKQAYVELATLYARQRRSREMTGILDRFLVWNPQDITFRLEKARVANQ